MSQTLETPRVRPHLALAAAAFAAVLWIVPGRCVAQSSSGDPSSPVGSKDEPALTKGKKLEKKKKVKLSKDQQRRLDIEGSGKSATEWYEQAVQIYRAGKYIDARAILLPLEDSVRAIDIQEQVKLLIADSYFSQGGALNLAEALARYKSFMTFFPASDHAEYVQFQIGRSYFKQLGPSDRDQSFTDNVVAEYQKFLDIYPNSQYAEQARREMSEAKVLRARHELHVAQFYWEWKDYRASATRLETLLAERPELPEREEALWMAAQSLYNSGERAKGDSYAARLAADYPASTYTARLDAGAAGGRAIEQQLKRQEESDAEADRTHRRQVVQDRRRTRQIRKDSGLPPDVPGITSTGTVPAAQPEPAAAAPAAPAETDAKASELEAKDRARREAAEREEEEAEARRAEQEKKRVEKQAAEDAERAAKAAKSDEKRSKMSPEEIEKAEAEEAKRAAAEKERVDELEAEEAKAADAKAERKRKKAEAEAAEAAKKAEKKARKKN